MTPKEALERRDRIRYNLTNHNDKEAADIAFDALEQQKPQSLSPWISTKEALPTQEGKYLCQSRHGTIFISPFRLDGQYFVVGNHAGVTHWMPLPKPATEDL